MASSPLPDQPPSPAARKRPPLPVKVVVAGGFGVGKTTAVASVSDFSPLTTEAVMTVLAPEIDDSSSLPAKRTTTVAMDFGCITIDQSLKLYLFGTPGQNRFGFMWGDITLGALGTLVIVYSRQLDDCYPAIDYFERFQLPFIVAVNRFDGQLTHDLDSIRWTLDVDPDIPIITFDARERHSVRDALLVVLRRALNRAQSAKAADDAESGPSAPSVR